MRLIDADALKKAITQNREIDRNAVCDVLDIIDNAPTVSEITKEKLSIAYDQGYKDGRDNWLQEERPQGEWVSVKDRLPDKDGDYIVTTEMFLPVNNFIREVEVTEYYIVSGFCCETHAIKVIAWQELILPNPYKEAEND